MKTERCELCGAFMEKGRKPHEKKCVVRHPVAAQLERVNHPTHYGGDVVHEVYKCLAEWGLVSNAYCWNAVKYIARAGKKDPAKTLEDLKKARWYLDREIERLEKP